MKFSRVLSLPFLIFLSSCARESDGLQTAQQFFQFCDTKDYKGAYQMLSESDRRAISVDSFYIACYKEEQDRIRIGSYSQISTFISARREDTLFVKQVFNRPDYLLIRRIKDKDAKFSDFFKKLDADKTVPMILDSSRTLRLVRQGKGYIVHCGFSDYKKYQEFRRITLQQNTSKVFVSLVSIKVSGIPYGKSFAVATVTIRNHSDFDLTNISSVLVIDHIQYRLHLFQHIKGNSTVEARSPLSGETDLPSKFIPFNNHQAIIPGSKAEIRIEQVHFDSSFDQFIEIQTSGYRKDWQLAFLRPGAYSIEVDN